MLEAIVLAGGFGTRLQQLVPDLPKPMAPVAGKPFLEILLDSLAEKGFTRVILSLGYMAEKITSHFGGRYNGIEIVYEIENKPLGTGGAVRQAMTCCLSDHVFVFNGDTFLDLEVQDVEDKWQKNQSSIIVALEILDVSRYGSLNLIDGKVSDFCEKGVSGSGLINAGCYVFSVSALDNFALGQSFSLETEYLAQEVKIKPLDCFISQGLFIDIGVPADYERAQIELVRFAHDLL